MDQCQNEIKPGQSTKHSNELSRDDFDGGPISLDNIDSRLYLGTQSKHILGNNWWNSFNKWFLGNVSAAVDVDTLNKYGITHILTLDTCPLPRSITELPHINVKFIHIVDQSKEDLLSHLEETNKFIDEALENGTVLVHW